MISIRFPVSAQVPAWLRSEAAVALLSSPELITLESEKNTDVHAEGVDRVLQPIIEDLWSQGPRTFGLISIETRSGCNNECSFCPVAHSVDPRPAGELAWAELTKIADDLSTLGFDGRIALFGNNEPLLDRRMPEIVELFRCRCPAADIRILSNGTKARVRLVEDLFSAGLSTLIINNYSDGQRINPPVRSLLRAADAFASSDIRISVRNKDEVLTTRGGTAPNKPTPTGPVQGFCALPFTDLYVTSTGNVALCCFDAYGRVCMGNVSESSLLEIWHSARFEHYREELMKHNRAALKICEQCDFDGFRDPFQRSGRPLTRDDLIGRR
jgi:radical SAM protein with 4Fe4S-binding SPASM domain